MADKADRGSCEELSERVSAWQAVIDDGLQIAQTGTIVDFDEGETLGIPLCANPARNLDTKVGSFRYEGLFDLKAEGHGETQIKN